MAEKALTAVIQKACVQGISTRSVDDLVKAMGMSGISKSQVSRLCEEIDGKVKAFLNRPIEGDWPFAIGLEPVAPRWLTLDRRDLPQGPAWRADRFRRRHHRHRGQQPAIEAPPVRARWQAVGARFWVWKSALPKPSRSGPGFFASSRGAACEA